MKAVKRWRYYCDHCKKVSGGRASMEKHEKGCTLNPARECGVCGVIDGSLGTPLHAMLALLPSEAQFVAQVEAVTYFNGFEDETIPACEAPDYEAFRAAVSLALPQLRELTNNCPACILAALRQKGIPVPMVEEFNFTTEMDAARQRMTEARAEQHPYGLPY